MANEHDSVKHRGQTFAAKPPTAIWEESPAPENPYNASAVRCYGYDLLDLMRKKSFPEVFFLLFTGELPTTEQAQLLEQLMLALINPGPRHPATRAAMNAGVGKTDLAHLLPIALNVLGGTHSGSGAVEDCMHFFAAHQQSAPAATVAEKVRNNPRPNTGDWLPLPGFGSSYGSIDQLAARIATHLAALPGAGPALALGQQLATELNPLNMGWLPLGYTAATLVDLGFSPRLGGGIFQLLSAPGLLAHGVEMYGKPITALPFPSDEDYIIEE